ncbi:MAG: cyclic beta 1-2 glucan synthetase, partial [Planctomycetes bacterium]|nr:cyclic beta 1-2 glucan synthetase [Planctomycetota bacterium]
PGPEGAAGADPGPGGAGAVREAIAGVATLRDLAALEHRLGPPPAAGVEATSAADRRLREAVATAGERAAARIRAAEDLALRCEELGELELDFLYDPMRKLLSIGYSLDGRHRDPGYYDLFASESRLASFLGIAQGRLPQEHWFLLGRQPTPGLETPTLLSWSGSMFEYLMPMLLMPTYDGTLLDQACRGAVVRQMRYGRQQRVPWGISESCYNQVDAQMNYQYRAFGVPELGLKRGLADDLVIAPYAGVMALMVMPEEACANLEAMARQDLVGRFGLYEAVDYTASRLKGNQSRAVVPTYMAHHSGMSLLALAHVLLGQPMQRRFLSDLRMRATVLLLQERIPAPRETARRGHAPPPMASRGGGQSAADAAVRIYTNPDARIPHVHLLSNGRYHAMVTSAGGGVSRWQDLNLTRWREDVTCDDRGFFFYLQDVDDRHTWSSTHQPMRRHMNTHEAIFSQARAEFRTVHRQIEAHTQISVSPEDDIELRRIVLTNLSNRPRTLELTSFAEAVLADPTAEVAHPAFNALFIQTETAPDRAAVLCTRRPRSAEESPPWMFHAMIAGGPGADEGASFETDRARFIGRGRSAADPAALDAPGPLSNTAGPVLDPCVAVRRRVRIEPNESVTIDAVTGVGRTRDEAMTLIDRYHDTRLTDRVFELAWTHSQVLLHHLGATEADAQLFARLASSIFFANPRHRANASQLARNRKGQADLWRYGISGDLPIVL